MPASNSTSKTAAIVELLQFVWKKKQWWLFPIIITLLVLGVLLTLAQTTPLGPLMYTIF